MDRKEALALLRGGEDGIAEWNRRRSSGEEIPKLKGASLKGADLHRVDLHGADLRDANLFGVDLTGADLTGADLSGANLFGAAVERAKLSKANFNRASLVLVNFIGADLSGANLSGADLNGTDLKSANLTCANFHAAVLRNVALRKANFTGASLRRTTIVNVKLTDVVGLEDVRHEGPSALGIDTIVRSNGQIPEVFLRGCGVPDSFIAFQKSLVAKPIEFYSCFISYSHADKSFARRLHDALQGRGIRCWLDEHEILPGDDIYQKVDEGLRIWDKVLLCTSEASLDSWWVEREIDRAFKMEKEIRKDPHRSNALAIIPLDLDGSFLNWDHPHAAALQKRLASDFTGWESDDDKFDAQFENVVKALRADEAARPEPPEPKL